MRNALREHDFLFLLRVVIERRGPQLFLKKKIASSKILSAAVPHLPWLGTNGKPSSDVSAYAAVIDYVNIMYVVQSFLFFHSSFLSRDLTGIEQEL